MGCGASSQTYAQPVPVEVVVDVVPSQKPISTTVATGEAASDLPRPFAVMRLAHEAIRAGMSLFLECCKQNKFEDSLTLYKELHNAIIVHTRQEDDVFFPMLNEMFDGVISKTGSHEEHIEEAKKAAVLLAGLQDACNGQTDGVLETVQDWLVDLEAHMKKEEDALLQLTEKTAPTVMEKGALVHKILAIDMYGFESSLLPYVVSQLDRTKPFAPIKSFVEAVQMSSSPSEFARHVATIQGCVKEETFTALVNCGATSEGKQPESF